MHRVIIVYHNYYDNDKSENHPAAYILLITNILDIVASLKSDIMVEEEYTPLSYNN